MNIEVTSEGKWFSRRRVPLRLTDTMAFRVAGLFAAVFGKYLESILISFHFTISGLPRAQLR